MKIYHPVLDVTEDVNKGLAGVLIEGSGWQPVDETEYERKVEAEKTSETPPGMSRAEALKKPKAPAKKTTTTKKKEID